jgi:hypothetical protein
MIVVSDHDDFLSKSSKYTNDRADDEVLVQPESPPSRPSFHIQSLTVEYLFGKSQESKRKR